jgi:hypothetical protein
VGVVQSSIAPISRIAALLRSLCKGLAVAISVLDRDWLYCYFVSRFSLVVCVTSRPRPLLGASDMIDCRISRLRC